MTITLLLLVLAVLTLALFFLRGVGPEITLDEALLSEHIQPVDVDAFCNLINAEEEEYLRSNLSLDEFRIIERQRLRAAVDYLLSLSHNAALLLHLGQSAKRSPDERIAQAGRDLVDNALPLRVFCVLAICKLYLQIIFPTAALQPSGIVDSYRQMTDKAAQLCRLQYSTHGALFSKVL
ncbi:MAG: hypothetical protein DMG81_00620 [Acidobacteria bacterium]|nr:MAG: hypothetical protein DMG81_00620 [Acidobacteriota bacterium]